MTLYTYVLRYDDGAAPNPYWGICTLAICKPVIRRTARVGDWVVGLGSKNAPQGDLSSRVVYAMEVTGVMSMMEYDSFCRSGLPGKIPVWGHSDYRKKIGDCIYDYSRSEQPKLRDGIHSEENRGTDLGGVNVLLSKNFYYFGDEPIELPRNLWPMVHQTQGHKSHANDKYVEAFVAWIHLLGLEKNMVAGEPQLKSEILSMEAENCRSKCSKDHEQENQQDSVC